MYGIHCLSRTSRCRQNGNRDAREVGDQSDTDSSRNPGFLMMIARLDQMPCAIFGGSRAAALIWLMPFRIRDRVVGRAHRYRAATRHPALPGLNSRVGAAMVATMVIRVPLLTTYATVKHVDVSLPLVACCLTERNTLHVG